MEAKFSNKLMIKSDILPLDSEIGDVWVWLVKSVMYGSDCGDIGDVWVWLVR